MVSFTTGFAAHAHAAAGASEANSKAAAPPPPYSVPWQLRPTAAASALRLDTALAFYEDPAANHGTTVATLLLGSFKVTPRLAPFLRLGLVRNSPSTGAGATSFANPVIGASHAQMLGQAFRLALTLGVALPLGTGGGDAPDPATAAATRSGILARSAMDNAMFAVNDLTVFPGFGLAYIADGLTVQAEATVLQLTRVRGEEVQPDSSKTNFTTGLHVGYFVLPQFSLSGELRYQRWLSTPSFVEADSALRDTLSVAVGVRLHLSLGASRWLRPGLAYARGLDDPMTRQNFHVLQLDLPVFF